MKFLSVLLSGLTLTPAAMAGVTAFDYRLGATTVTEDQQQIVVHAQPPVTVAILPGGKTWPTLSLDEAGHIYAGATVIDAATGRHVSHTDAALALPHAVEIALSAEGYLFRRGGNTRFGVHGDRALGRAHAANGPLVSGTRVVVTDYPAARE